MRILQKDKTGLWGEPVGWAGRKVLDGRGDGRQGCCWTKPWHLRRWQRPLCSERDFHRHSSSLTSLFDRHVTVSQFLEEESSLVSASRVKRRSFWPIECKQSKTLSSTRGQGENKLSLTRAFSLCVCTVLSLECTQSCLSKFRPDSKDLIHITV